MAARLFLVLAIAASLQLAGATATVRGVTMRVQDDQVIMDNGIVQVALSKPQGQVTGVGYNGVWNLLDHTRSRNSGGYWDVVWNFPESDQPRGFFDVLDSTEFNVVSSSEEQVELSFKSTLHPPDGDGVRLSIDKRFVMLQGSSGFYSYAIFEHQREWPALNISVARLTFKLHPDKFNYMAISDDIQRYMPSAIDRESPRGAPLAYREAVLLTDPKEPQFKGQVDDKYAYSMDSKDNKVHGWINSDSSIGFWVITPSNEFKCGGPLKRDLTSHVGPTSLTVFLGTHYVGNDIVLNIEDGEYWEKVLGPVFIYLNSGPDRGEKRDLWRDAKAQAQSEASKWPYNFPVSVNFEKANQRGSATGRLWVRDRYISQNDKPAGMAYIGLASPGQPGSWATESKNYQFWTRTSFDGTFTINNIKTGIYNLYAWVPGFLGDYMFTSRVNITSGHMINFGDLVFEPPRSGPTLWEIGVPDRTAAEFFIPDPNPKYLNGLFLKKDRYRQYGLWERYDELYPNNDVIFTVGSSNCSIDWFFAHVNRKVDDSYAPTTRQIKFQLDNVKIDGIYTLRIALAAAHMSRLQVQVNEGKRGFITQVFGQGNVIARHGIHGIQWNFNFNIKGSLLSRGENTIHITQMRPFTVFYGVMYDYIRLEGPSNI